MEHVQFLKYREHDTTLDLIKKMYKNQLLLPMVTFFLFGSRAETIEKHFNQVYDKSSFHIVFMKIREESHVFRRAFTLYFHQPGADRGGNCRMSPGKKKNKARQYFIDLQRWRSLVALIACCDTFFSLLPQSFLL